MLARRYKEIKKTRKRKEKLLEKHSDLYFSFLCLLYNFGKVGEKLEKI